MTTEHVQTIPVPSLATLTTRSEKTILALVLKQLPGRLIFVDGATYKLHYIATKELLHSKDIHPQSVDLRKWSAKALELLTGYEQSVLKVFLKRVRCRNAPKKSADSLYINYDAYRRNLSSSEALFSVRKQLLRGNLLTGAGISVSRSARRRRARRGKHTSQLSSILHPAPYLTATKAAVPQENTPMGLGTLYSSITLVFPNTVIQIPAHTLQNNILEMTDTSYTDIVNTIRAWAVNHVLHCIHDTNCICPESVLRAVNRMCKFHTDTPWVPMHPGGLFYINPQHIWSVSARPRSYPFSFHFGHAYSPPVRDILSQALTGGTKYGSTFYEYYDYKVHSAAGLAAYLQHDHMELKTCVYCEITFLEHWADGV